MQRHDDGTLVVSATDLVGFLECDHLVTLEEARARGEIERPYHFDPQLELLRRRGFEHEQAEIARLQQAGRTVVEMQLREPRTPDELRASQAETLAAMTAGVDVIFQATVYDGRWRGHPDFLVRRSDRPSSLGSWSYDVADTKLASHVKAAAILQMCVYADLLERLQGIPPQTLTVVTGDAAGHAYRFEDYGAYYRSAKDRFETRVFGPGGATEATYPEPVAHCDICPWWSACLDRRRADDHLSIVAGTRRTQRRRLVAAGVPTLTALAELPAGRAVPRLPARALARLRRQASLQLEARRTGVPRYELVPPDPDDPGRGLAGLPAPSELDVFFDLEADPLATDGGLEYLWGWAEVGADGEPAYQLQWAHDRAGEKAALEAFVDLVMARRARDPGMHVYHYGGYESGALKRLMQRHATREDEIDVLLRGQVLVNLWDGVVRGGIQAGVESYSIKRLEVFYMPEREGGITSAGFSIVEYERWLETRDPAILEAIGAYNRDDCISNLRLRDWLEDRRVEALESHPEWYPDGAVPRPALEDGLPPESLAAAQAATRDREDRLRAGIPADRSERTDVEQARWLLAAVLDWHRREARPQWWDHFRLRRADAEELVADSAALGGLAFEADLGRIKQSTLQRYRFDPDQDTKIDRGDALGLGPDLDANPISVTVEELDPIAGIVDVKVGRGNPPLRALIPTRPYDTRLHADALGRLADHVIAHGLEGDGAWRAARDLLLRARPRIAGLAPGEPLVAPGEAPVAAARRIGLALRDTVLAIQGPPGTGKTWTAARMVLDLVAAGRRVGVTAQSHRVIANALDSICRAAADEGRALVVAQRTDEPELVRNGVERLAETADAVAGIRADRWNVLGGTAWLWSRPDAVGAIDVLVVDEAGQFSLADTLAVSAAAGSVVLVGDPNQLPQVSSGSHPEGAEASALEHLIGEARTIPPDRGILLDTTYRLHPAINDFISPAFYEGRLETDPATALRSVAAGAPIGGSGVRQVPIRTEDRSNRSPEEADWIVDALAALRGRPWRDRDGVERPLQLRDILVVAPYNAQVAEIGRRGEARLGERPNVGTVDRFQGREAPVAIYSMATSSPEDAPRDVEFLYSGNRLNVAISRAQALAVLVANPELVRIACRTPEQMALVNLLCRYLETAQAASTGPPVRTRRRVGPGVERLDLGL